MEDVARNMRQALNRGDADVNEGGVRVFVLADTTFGSCCVDEVAAAHHNADCIVHFGRACMVGPGHSFPEPPTVRPAFPRRRRRGPGHWFSSQLNVSNFEG